MYAATMARLTVGAIAHPKGLWILSSTPGLAHGNGDSHHLHHHSGVAPGNTPEITGADPTKLLAISLHALEKSGHLKSVEDVQLSLGTDKVLAGPFQVLSSCSAASSRIAPRV